MNVAITRSNFEMFFCNLSPCIDDDDEFFAAIRAMTGLSSKKPPVQNRHMTTGDTERVRELLLPLLQRICDGVCLADSTGKTILRERRGLG